MPAMRDVSSVRAACTPGFGTTAHTRYQRPTASNGHWQHQMRPGAIGGPIRARGDLAGALACFEEDLALSRAVVVARGTPADQRELSVALNNVGSIRRAQGDLAGALACYEESLALSRAVVAARGTPEDQRGLGVALNWVGRIRRAQGDLTGALACFEESVSLSRAVVAARGTPED
jgi:tetratricopeptide (TPR) repeat protein